MSLFHVIKYGNINLESIDQLKSLPEDILRDYYKNFYGIPITSVPLRSHRICHNLAVRFTLEKGDDNLNEDQRAAFLKTLLEYDND